MTLYIDWFLFCQVLMKHDIIDNRLINIDNYLQLHWWWRCYKSLQIMRSFLRQLSQIITSNLSLKSAVSPFPSPLLWTCTSISPGDYCKMAVNTCDGNTQHGESRCGKVWRNLFTLGRRGFAANHCPNRTMLLTHFFRNLPEILFEKRRAWRNIGELFKYVFQS